MLTSSKLVEGSFWVGVKTSASPKGHFVGAEGTENLSRLYNAYHFLRLVEVLELDDAVSQSKERVVAAASDVQAGEELRSPLSDEDASGGHHLSPEALHSKTLCVAIAAIPRASHSFFVCHASSPTL